MTENNDKQISNGVKIFFATDHAGFQLKNELLEYVSSELGYEVVDEGAHEYNGADDYPDFIHKAARAVADDPENRRAIILGRSGQGEAMVANRYNGVRAAVYYGAPSISQVNASDTEIDILTSTRVHNNANVLSLGAGFLTTEDAKIVVASWLGQGFPAEERHLRRIQKIEEVDHQP